MASERKLSMREGLSYGIRRLAGVYGVNYAIPSLTRWVQGVGFGDLRNHCVNCFEKQLSIHIWSDHGNEAAHPILATDGADMLIRLTHHDQNGIFHCFGSESTNRIELAKRCADVFGGDSSLIKSVPLDNDVRVAFAQIPIPHRTVASTQKTTQELGRKAFNVVEGLSAFKQELDVLKKQHSLNT